MFLHVSYFDQQEKVGNRTPHGSAKNMITQDLYIQPLLCNIRKSPIGPDRARHLDNEFSQSLERGNGAVPAEWNYSLYRCLSCPLGAAAAGQTVLREVQRQSLHKAYCRLAQPCGHAWRH